MVSVESVLEGVKEVVGFPGVADAVCQYAGSELADDSVELFSACMDIWNVGKGFPDDVGEVGGDLEVGYFRMEGVPREECSDPDRIFLVLKAVVFWGSAEVPFELCGGGLKTFDGVGEVM
jgi:hypothetical protein